jgi:exodeoxyribonuclease VII large subunit
VLERKASSSLLDCRERRPRELERLALALAGHEPQRTLERGYVLALSPDGEPLPTAASAREQAALRLRFADDELTARLTGE